MPAQTPSPSSSSHLTQLQTNGFVVIPSILPPSQLTLLRTAAQQATALARAGKWPHVRTVGKQFPPWNPADAQSQGIWGVQHLMSPQLPGHAEFTALYFSEEILGIVKELLGNCGDEELVMELFNMLVRPERDFELRWHRDDIPAEASAEEEMERLGRPAFHAQYNLALWEDESLVVVPGSHVRARTEVERRAGPFEKELPGQLVVKLEPGDIVFYNNNILHRGVYDSTKERATLHGSVGHVAGSRLRARNVLQHGVGAWVDGVDLGQLGEVERRRAEGMRERLVRMGGESGEVGYSLEG
ncbi:phytanoyl-CoA dioxygenase [Trichoderma longibrachiatum]